MPDLTLEILEWAKTKEDLAEIYYENRTLAPPVRVNIVFDREAASSNGKRLFYLNAPTIGEVRFKQNRVRRGEALLDNELLGFVEGTKEKIELRSPTKGKIEEVLVPSGRSVGFGEPLLLIETNLA